jgi:UDP-N-acetylglucosamine 2-epimerase (non-hydrolysing)
MSAGSLRVVLVAGARPNFVKVAPIVRAMEASNASDGGALRFCPVLVHTGQHYDPAMSRSICDDVGLPEPDYFLAVGSSSHAQQTAAVMVEFEKVLREEQPHLVVVVGDVNSTLAAALVCVKECVPVAHVEAGLRSGDRAMPEEVNRVLTDHMCDLLFTTCPDGDVNLLAEGIDREKLRCVGNTMIDSQERCLDEARRSPVLDDLGLTPREYGVVTLHRPSNVDDAAELDRLVGFLSRVSESLPLVYPVHPRARSGLGRLAADDRDPARLRLVDPLGYVDFLRLMSMARLVLTDSGGVQEETSVLGVPCVTLRTSTERPITIAEGTNHLVSVDDLDLARRVVREILAEKTDYAPRRPALWDGHAGVRVVEAIAEWAASTGVGKTAAVVAGDGQEAKKHARPIR